MPMLILTAGVQFKTIVSLACILVQVQLNPQSCIEWIYIRVVSDLSLLVCWQIICMMVSDVPWREKNTDLKCLISTSRGERRLDGQGISSQET